MKKIVRVDTIKARPRLLDEIPVLIIAIRNKCYACKGGSAESIRDCDDLECWLWPARFGNEWKTARNQIRNAVAEEQRRRGK